MSEPEYICIACSRTWTEDNLFSCPKCGDSLCRKCGGEVQTIEEYDEAMRVNAE